MNKKERGVVYILGFASMINDASSEAIYSMLPYYINNPALIGLFGGLFNGLGSILKIIFGYLSDYFGKRKPFILLGYFISAVAKTMMSIASLFLLPIMIVLDRVGKGIRDSPRDAILGTLKEKGYAFGIHRAFDTAGALFGTILAYLMLSYFSDYRTAILIAGGIAFLTIIPLAFLPEFKVERVRDSFIQSIMSLSPDVKRILIPAILLGFSFISPMLFISGSKGELALSAILLYAVYNIFHILSSIYLGKKSDIIGRKKVMVIGALFTVFAFIFMYLASVQSLKILFALAFIFYGAGVGAFIPAAFAYIGDTAKSKGVAMGVFQCIYGISILISSTIFGIFLNRIGSIIFLIYSVLPFLAMLAIAMI